MIVFLWNRCLRYGLSILFGGTDIPVCAPRLLVMTIHYAAAL
jgi:hypothetical protein